MTLTPFLPFVLLVIIAQPALADSPTGSVQGADCPLSGAFEGPDAACTALRVTFSATMQDCMAARAAEAQARAGTGHASNSHTQRARRMLCDVQVREKLGLAD